MTPPQTVIPSGSSTPARPVLAYEPPPVAAAATPYEAPTATPVRAPGGDVIDPAPFVGTRESGPVPTIRMSSALPFLSIATPPSNPGIPATGSLTVTLADLVRRIEKGELKVTGYREGMSAEATLVAVLAAMLTRER